GCDIMCTYSYDDLLACPSFPTRRSSDLPSGCVGPELVMRPPAGTSPDPGRSRMGYEKRSRSSGGPLHRPGPHVGHHPNGGRPDRDRKSTRLNSSHVKISYAVFCLKKKNW